MCTVVGAWHNEGLLFVPIGAGFDHITHIKGKTPRITKTESTQETVYLYLEKRTRQQRRSHLNARLLLSLSVFRLVKPFKNMSEYLFYFHYFPFVFRRFCKLKVRTKPFLCTYAGYKEVCGSQYSFNCRL